MASAACNYWANILKHSNQNRCCIKLVDRFELKVHDGNIFKQLPFFFKEREHSVNYEYAPTSRLKHSTIWDTFNL